MTDTNRTSKPKLEDFPHPQGGYSTMSFHNALIYWQEREIERLQRDNDRLNDYIKGLPDNESCAHPAMKGTQAYKCELCGQLEERNADETSACRYEAAIGAVCNKCGRIHDFGQERCAECQTPRLCGVERECLRNRYVRPAVEPTRCIDCGVSLVPEARHFSGCKSHPGERAVKAK